MPEVAAVLDMPPTPKLPAEAPVSASSPQPPSEAPEPRRDQAGQEPPLQEPAAGPQEGQDAPSTNEADARPLAEQVREVAGKIVTSKIRHIDDRYSKMSRDERVQRGTQHRGEGALLTLRAMVVLPELCKKLEGGLKVVKDGQAVTVTGIQSYTDDTFRCSVEGSDKLMDFSRQEVYDAQLLAEADEILKTFPPDSPQRAALALHIQTLRIQTLREGEASLPDSATVDATLKAASESLARGREEVVLTPQERAVAIVNRELVYYESVVQNGTVQGFTMSREEGILRLLRLAQRGNGEGGVVYRALALATLAQERRLQKPELLLVGAVRQQALDAREAIIRELNPTEQQRQALESGDLDVLAGLMETKLAKNPEGFAKFIFGENMSNEDIAKLLLLQGKSGRGLWVMILSFLFEKMFFEPLVSQARG